MEKKNTSLGIISFIFGILALLTICMGVEIFPAIIGFVIGIIAIVKANCKKGLAIAGVVLSSIAIVTFFFTILGYVQKAHDRNVQEIQTEQVGQTTQRAEDTEQADNELTIGDTANTDHLQIHFLKMSECKKDQYEQKPGKGNMFYKFDFDITNTSDADILVSAYTFTCYADDYNLNQTIGSDDLFATLSGGKKVKGSVYFQAPKDTKVFEIEYREDNTDNEKVCFKVDNK